MSKSSNLSGLQREVLGLYRSLLREAIKKDKLQQGTSKNSNSISSVGVSGVGIVRPLFGGGGGGGGASTSTTVSYVRSEFRRQCNQVERNDYKRIEYQIRQGYKQVKVLQMPGVKMVRKIS